MQKEATSVYLDIAIALNAVIDFLLIVGSNRLCGYPLGGKRAALAAAVGGLYGGACLIPGIAFLGGFFWRLLFLAVMAAIAFGVTKSAVRRAIVFILLSMALGGAAQCIGKGGIPGLIAAAGAICLMCAFGFRGRIGQSRFLPVELSYGGKQMHLTALCDTGNMLRDAVTGRPVLVVGAEVAQKLLGLSGEQIASPVETVGTLPGLRLIPYRSVGKKGGMLLGMRFSQVRIGDQRGSTLVAFAPEGLSGEYQALTGGIL